MATRSHRRVDLKRLVHRTLLVGVGLSGLLLTAGLVLLLIEGNEHAADEVPDVRRLAEQALAGNGTAVVQIGLIVLMLTPAWRVIVLGIGWAMSRRWRMAAVAAIVAALLAVSVTLGVK